MLKFLSHSVNVAANGAEPMRTLAFHSFVKLFLNREDSVLLLKDLFSNIDLDKSPIIQGLAGILFNQTTKVEQKTQILRMFQTLFFTFPNSVNLIFTETFAKIVIPIVSIDYMFFVIQMMNLSIL